MLDEVVEAIADALEPVAAAVGNGLVVQARYVDVPAAPTLDIYWGGQPEDLGFGDDQTVFWTVRARIHTPDHEGAQTVLLQLLEPWGTTSVREAIYADETLSGTVQSADIVDGPSELTLIASSTGQTFLGVTWRVRTITWGST